MWPEQTAAFPVKPGQWLNGLMRKEYQDEEEGGANKQPLFYSPYVYLYRGKENGVNNCIVVVGTHPHWCSAGSGFQLFHSVETDWCILFIGLDIVEPFFCKENGSLLTTFHYIIVEIRLFIYQNFACIAYIDWYCITEKMYSLCPKRIYKSYFRGIN